MPLAADGQEALNVAIRPDAGLRPVIVGKLVDAKKVDVGTKMYGKAYSAREL